MKCPQCLANQKYKDGMTCRGCGYRFALDPKKPPYITDSAFKSALLKLSHQGRYWFTRDQLYVRIHRLIQQKKRIRNLGFHPGNVDRLKSPVWIPEALRDKEPKRTPKGSAADHLQNGYRLPLGIAPPGALAGTLALAVTAGLSLMSEELLAMQQESAASGSGGISFGFG